MIIDLRVYVLLHESDNVQISKTGSYARTVLPAPAMNIINSCKILQAQGIILRIPLHHNFLNAPSLQSVNSLESSSH